MTFASSDLVTSRSSTIWPLASRCRILSPWSALTKISIGTRRGWLALSTVGRSMMAGVTSGAVTMKITSSTSITSTYGTMLMSCIGPRLRCRAGMVLLHRLAMEDVGELLHEALEAVAQALDVVRVAVVRHHRRDGGEQADRRGDERLGDAGRHLRERRLLNVREAAKGVHDAPYRAEQADVGTHRPRRGEKGQRALEEIHLALKCGAHRAPRPVHHVARVAAAALPAQLGELAEAGLEDALQAADGVAVGDRALVERGELVAAPELALELLCLAARAPDREPLLEDEHPRQEGHRDQQHQHHLDDDAGVDDQGPDIDVLRHGHLSACSSSWGKRAGFIRSRFTSASVMSASTRSSPPRSTRWRKTRLARPILTTSALTDSSSLRCAGRWYFTTIWWTRNSTPCLPSRRARSMPAALRSSLRARS